MSARFGLVGKNPPGPIWGHLKQFFHGLEKSKHASLLHIFLHHCAQGSNKCANYLFPHPGWIAARAHQGKNVFFLHFFDFFGPWKNGPRWPQIGPGGLSTNPDLADILGRTDFNFENSYFLYCFVPQISGFPGPQISKFLDFQVPRSPNSKISRLPDFQTPPAPAPPPDEFSDPNLTPLPTHPGIKYVARALAATQ